MLTAGDANLKGIEIESIRKLLETCVNPIITYGGETWEASNTEMREMNKILDNIIKRILMTPVTTPREALYIETGLLDINHTVMKNRINMDKRLTENSNNLLTMILNTQEETGWKKTTEMLKQENGIQPLDMIGSRETTKKMVKKRVEEKFKKNMTETASEKSKVQHLLTGINDWQPNKRPKYMMELTRREVSAIFKARTRMLDIKNNFRGKYNNTVCRKCNKETESQDHILQECSEGDDIPIKVKTWEIFSSNTIILKNAARKIQIIMEDIEKRPLNPRPRTSAAPL